MWTKRTYFVCEGSPSYPVDVSSLKIVTTRVAGAYEVRARNRKEALDIVVAALNRARSIASSGGK